MTALDARTWTPPDHATIRATLPQTQAGRDELARRIGVKPRTMRYWWTGARTPSFAQWRLIIDMSGPASGR